MLNRDGKGDDVPNLRFGRSTQRAPVDEEGPTSAKYAAPARTDALPSAESHVRQPVTTDGLTRPVAADTPESAMDRCNNAMMSLVVATQRRERELIANEMVSAIRVHMMAAQADAQRGDYIGEAKWKARADELEHWAQLLLARL